MAVVKGSDLMLFKRSGNEGSYTYKSLGAATNHTLTASVEVIETSNKDTGIFGDSEAGKVSWSMTSENMMIETDYDELMDALLAREKLFVAFSIAKNANSIEGKPEGGWAISDGGYEGEVLLTQLDSNAPDNDKATYTATFTGCGPLKKRSAQ